MKVFGFFPDEPPIIQALCEHAAKAASEMTLCTSKTALLTELKAAPVGQSHLIFMTSEHLPLARSLAKDIPGNKMALFLRESIPSIAADLINFHAVYHLLPMVQDTLSERSIGVLLRKFGSQEIFGLKHYFPDEVECAERIIRSTEQKSEALESIGAAIRAHTAKSNREIFTYYGHRICESVDELILNAVFVANPRFQSQPRVHFDLAEGEGVRLQWAFDGSIFGLSVTDDFGSLRKDTVLKYLDQKNARGEISVNPSGGLGLKRIFSRSHELIVNVAPGKRTEFISLLKLESRAIDFERRHRSFQFFQSRSTEPNHEGEQPKSLFPPTG